MHVRDSISRDIDDTLAAIVETKKLLALRPSRSQEFALAGFQVQLARLREELKDFDRAVEGAPAASPLPEVPASGHPITS